MKKEILQIAKPILFKPNMVRAILDGRKSVTRRAVKFPVNGFTGKIPNANDTTLYANTIHREKVSFREEPFYCLDVKKPCKVGDNLYVRETFCQIKDIPHWTEYYRLSPPITPEEYVYKADNIGNKPDGIVPEIKWRPSIHMPKEAARIFLRVTDVRAKRLQDMWASDVPKEGIYFTKPHTADEMITKFANLWDSTILKKDLDKYGWNANPWVWVIEFERVEALHE